MSYENLDIKGKMVAVEFAHFQNFSTIALTKNVFINKDSKRVHLLYMYGALDCLIQNGDFMQSKLKDTEDLSRFLSFLCGILESLYINSLTDGVFEVKNDHNKINTLFHEVDQRLLQEDQFKIVLSGGQAAVNFLNGLNADTMISEQLALKRLISTTELLPDNKKISIDRIKQDLKRYDIDVKPGSDFYDLEDNQQDSNDEWYDIKNSEQYQQENYLKNKEVTEDDLPF